VAAKAPVIDAAKVAANKKKYNLDDY